MKRPRKLPTFSGERVISIKQACKLPCFVRAPAYRKMLRWARQGIRGVVLESRREGGSIMTSAEAVERFLERTNGR